MTWALSRDHHRPNEFLITDLSAGDTVGRIIVTGKCSDKKALRKIAAAHDMYEALKSLLDMDVSYGRGAAVIEAEKIARAALAKAEGKS